MKVIKNINNLHASSVPKKLGKGEVVKYQLLIGQPNPDPDKAKTRPIVYPTLFQIPSTDRIWDAHKNDYVDIALVQSWDKDNNIIAKPIWVPSTDNGIIELKGGSVTDGEQYEIMELLNCNESNPNRDASVPALFKRIDEEKDSKTRSKKRSSLKESLTYALNMTDGQVKDFAASLGWNEQELPGVLRDKVEHFAQTDPEGFLKHVESKDVEVKTAIKKAITAGGLAYDAQQHRIVLVSTNSTLIKMDRAEGVDFLTQAAEYVLHNKNGQKVFDTIKKLLADNKGV